MARSNLLPGSEQPERQSWPAVERLDAIQSRHGPGPMTKTPAAPPRANSFSPRPNRDPGIPRGQYSIFLFR
ncbi:hypothetical protein BDW66DRAFT_134453 [Aspergillus desertorum]